MYIIVVGGGRLGFHLSRTLLSEGHEVLVLEKDALECERIIEDMGNICMRGDGCEIATLASAGTERADMLIAVTNEDEDNLVACQVAKHKFGVPRTIAWINNAKNENLFKKLGINVSVSTSIILEHIEEAVPTHHLTHLAFWAMGEWEAVEIKIPPDSRAVGKRLREIPLPPGSFISMILGEGKQPQPPTQDAIIEANDRLVAITRSDSEETLYAVLTAA